MRRVPPRLSSLAVIALVSWPALAHAADADFSSALQKGWLWAYMFAFGYGFLTSLTPCVYPMIPITVAVFGARDTHVSRRKSFVLATCYVQGMALLYAALGTAFAKAGKASGAGELLGNPWVVVPIALLFILLAASMFGAFDLNLPTSVQNKLSSIGGKGYGGAFAMGMVGGVIAAPCTGPPLLTLLLWVGTTGRVLVGATLLYVYALGMGILFWVLAVFAGSIPKSGRWMDAVKSFFGVVMLVAAIYYLGNVSSLEGLHHGRPELRFLLVCLLFAVMGVAVGGIHLSFHSDWGVRLRKAAGVALLVVGAAGTINWILAPERELAWRSDEAAAFAEAKADGKHVLMDFGAEWCTPCKEIEKIVGSSEIYDDIDAKFVPLRIDLSQMTDAERELQKKWDAQTLPAVRFVSADGAEIGRYDEKSPSTASFRAKLKEVISAHPLD